MLTAGGRGLAMDRMAAWADQMAAWVGAGHELVIVSSGAVAEGMVRMGLPRRPSSLHELQALAAIGQAGLVQAYESCFKKRGLHAAQVLLTHDDLIDRQRYLNARTTLRQLVEWIRQFSESALDMIQGILVRDRLEAGGHAFDLQVIDLEPLLRELGESHRTQWSGDQKNFNLTLSPAARAVTLGDLRPPHYTSAPPGTRRRAAAAAWGH